VDSINVLLVEDTADDAELLIREMRAGGLDVIPMRVDVREALERALEQFPPHIILSDYALPGLRRHGRASDSETTLSDTPFIFVSGTIGEERAIDALKEGATDYVLKDNRARLVPAIRRALTEANERRARPSGRSRAR
jgi:DNA-binding NtrC family response regulator